VNKGWLQQYRDNAPERVLKETKAGSGKIKVGASVDKADGYKTLDALAYDAINGLIHEAVAEHPELVVIVGRDLLADKYFPVLNKDQAPSEQVAADMVISQKAHRWPPGCIRAVLPRRQDADHHPVQSVAVLPGRRTPPLSARRTGLEPRRQLRIEQ
jgi:hypothetical protein